MPTPGRKLRWVLIIAAAALVVVAIVVLYVLLHKPGNVSHPNVSFTDTSTASTTPTTPAEKPATFSWPRYGYDAGRTRAFTADPDLVPPFKQGWTYDDHALLEFPPDIYGNDLYFLDDNGYAKDVGAVSGHTIWRTQVGTLAAATPGIDAHDKLAIVPTLSGTGHSPGNGRIVALHMKTGKIAWSHPLAAGSESSPIVYGSEVYLGSGDGTVYAMDARTGHVIWTYHAQGAVKGGPALVNGILYFGDYAGRAYALRAKNGHVVWDVSTSGTHFGFGSGTFYSTPAVAFGRVYMGNTDGFVYSFAAKTGKLAWRTGTGNYVYGSPAVADVKGLGPTVYVGSYDGKFYAFNARSGAVRWAHPSGGRISGAATIVNDVVYYSDLGTKKTIGLNTRTGHVVFGWNDGAFNPVVADHDTLFLDGYGAIYQLLPKAQPVAPTAPATQPANKSAKRSTRPPARKPATRHAATPRHAATRPVKKRRQPRHHAASKQSSHRRRRAR